MLMKAFRLFVSSTFADFAQERELLQTRIFPNIDRYCAERGFQFLPIDLRWGINAEAQLNQRTSDICLGEVRAAKGYPPPNFLILMGNRYGWVPLPYAIPRAEYETLLAWLEREGRPQDASLLSAIYELDENFLGGGDEDHSSGTYTLRSREDDIPQLRPPQAWFDYESRARSILQEAADANFALGQINRNARDRYFASLTEQEILLGVPGLTTLADLDHATDPTAGTGHSGAVVFIREFDENPQGGLGVADIYRDRESNVEFLKSKLRRLLPDDDILSECAIIGPDRQFDDRYLEAFVALTERALMKAIDRHIALIEASETEPHAMLQGERAAHQGFADQRSRKFVGREATLGLISTYLAGEAEHPLIVFGPSGVGKSALMAKAVAVTEATSSHPVICRFVGASVASSDVRSLLMSLIDDLGAHGIVQQPSTYEAEIRQFCDQIKALLSAITVPVTIFLDALDQLNKPYRLDWLPSRLPTSVRLVISVLEDPAYKTDSAIYRSFRERFPQDAFIQVQPLSAGSGREMLMALERDAGCNLRETQRKYLLDRFDAAGGSPLYLTMAFAIAQSWKSTNSAGSGRHVLAGDTSSLITQFIDELTAVHYHERTLVSRIFGYLSAARDGLSVKELTDVLARDADVMRSISSEQFSVRTNVLPAAVWVRLHRQLAPFLVQRRIDDQPLFHFFHRQLSDVVRQLHYESASEVLHQSLSVYFDTRKLAKNGAPTYNKRSLSELPYQLHMAGAKPRLGQILMSPEWLRQKLETLGVRRLVGDYDFAFDEAQKLVGRTLQLVADSLQRDTRQLVPQLMGRLMGSDMEGVPAFLSAARKVVSFPALMPERPSLLPPGSEVARFEILDFTGMGLVALPGNRLATGSFMSINIIDAETGEELQTLGSHEGPVGVLALLNQDLLASAVGNLVETVIRVWDLRSSELRLQLEGHTATVHGLAQLDMNHLVSGSDDGTICIWNFETGACVSSIKAHMAGVSCLAVLKDGSLASGSNDGTIRIWNVAEGVETHCLVGHVDRVTALVELPDGRLASGSIDNGTIRIWELGDGMDHVSLATGTTALTALTLLPDGRLVSGSQDGTICFWEIDDKLETVRLRLGDKPVGRLVPLPRGRLACRSKDSRSIHVLDCSSTSGNGARQAHDSAIVALCVLADGRVASGSSDRLIKLWDANSLCATTRLSGHLSEVSAIAGLVDNRLVSGSADGSICLWHPESPSESRRLADHGSRVNAIVPLPDGRLASGASDGTIRLWSGETGEQMACLEGHTASVLAMAMHPDGTLISGGGETVVRFWDVGRDAELRDLKLFIVRGMAVLPDGRLVLGHAPAFCVYDPLDGSRLVRFTGHRSGLIGEIAQGRSIVVLSNGYLATGAGDNSVRVWNPDNGHEIACLEIDGRVTSLAALPDGRLVAGDIRGQLHWLKLAFEARDVPDVSKRRDDANTVVAERTLGENPDELNSYIVLQDLRDAADFAEKQAMALEAELQLGDAMEALKVARAKREAAVRDFPDWTLCKIELAETLRTVGRFLDRNGYPLDGCSAYDEAIKLYAGLSSVTPDNLDLLRKWRSALLTLGSALQGSTDFDRGLICFAWLLRIARLMVATAPENLQSREALALSHYNLGYMRSVAGNAPGAHFNFAEADLIFASIGSHGFNNVDWQAQRDRLRQSIQSVAASTAPSAGHDEAEITFSQRALSRARDHVDLLTRLVAIDPDNTDCQFDLASAYELYGNALVEHDLGVEAIKSYTAAFSIRQRLQEAYPASDQARYGLISVHDKLGDEFTKLGLKEDAIENFRATAAIQKTLVDAVPSSERRRIDLLASCSRIGGLLMEKERYTEAIDILNEALTIRGYLAAVAPENAERQLGLIETLDLVGHAYATVNDLQSARQHIQEALDRANKLIGQGPDTADLCNRIATFSRTLGEFDAQDKAYESAKRSYEYAVTMRAISVKGAPDNITLQEELQVDYTRLGGSQILSGTPADGVSSFLQSHSIIERLLEADPGRIAWQYRLAKSYFNLAIGYQDIGDQAGARAAAGAGQAILQEFCRRFPDDIALWESELAKFDAFLVSIDVGS